MRILIQNDKSFYSFPTASLKFTEKILVHPLSTISVLKYDSKTLRSCTTTMTTRVRLLAHSSHRNLLRSPHLPSLFWSVLFTWYLFKMTIILESKITNTRKTQDRTVFYCLKFLDPRAIWVSKLKVISRYFGLSWPNTFRVRTVFHNKKKKGG